MFTFLDHLSKHLILLVRQLYGLKDNFAIDHAKIWPEILRQAVIPVLEAFIGSARSLLATLVLISCCSVIVPVLGTKASIELILEAVHEGAITRGLGSVVLDAIVSDHTALSVVKWCGSTPLIPVASINFITVSVEVHFCFCSSIFSEANKSLFARPLFNPLFARSDIWSKAKRQLK